jgi:hypothetical protein
MATVIKGLFPDGPKAEKKKDDQPVPSYIIHISITFSDPLIWRRVQVPGRFNLSQLHEVIQKAMGWADGYVHQFLIGKISYEPTMKTNIPIRESKRFDEYKYQLHTLEEGMQFMFSYIYGAGEGWEHVLHLEEVVTPARELKHAILLAGEGACPPEEEVSDIHEYQQLLVAHETPGHKQENVLRERTGRPDFDPYDFDLDGAKSRVSQIQ